MADDLIRRSDVLNPYLEFSLPRGARHLVTDSLIAFFDYVKSVPSVDAVEVIRCHDCEWYKTNYTWDGKERKVCGIEPFEPIRQEEDYCAYGERRE